jgi:D-sedoheptulose 7-phosphate isomerase
MENFIKTYFENFYQTGKKIDKNEIEKLKTAILQSRRIYIFGNGGSAANAIHFANDLLVGLQKYNYYIDVICLNENMSSFSAIANDYGYENVFYTQLKNRLKRNDLVIAISCSGNSKNILKAVKYAKSIKATIASFTGFDGGKLKNISDIKIHIPTIYPNYGLTEDLHLCIMHLVVSYLKFEKEKT